QTLFTGLPALVMMTPAEAQRLGADADAILAYLRAHPAQLHPPTSSPIGFSVTTLTDSLSAYRSGHVDDAYRLAVTAYLEGFELTEASLDNRDHALRLRTEAAMMGYRNAVKAGRPTAEVEADYHAAVSLLEQAERQLIGPTASTSANFLSSLVIIL